MNIDVLVNRRNSPQEYHGIEQMLDQFSPIYLSEMANVSLLDRIDTKYLFTTSELYTVLERVQSHYRILDIHTVRLNRYHTVYYDVPDFTFYNQHHNQYGTRFKVRTRQYVDSNLAFFEVKHKTNKKRTIKSRLRLGEGYQNTEIHEFIDHHLPVDADHLEPKLWNDYMRLTLVGKEQPERVTIDLDLSFGQANTFVRLPGLVIAEVKQDHFSPDSYFIQQIRQCGIRPSSFSKYCAGVALLYDNVKTNNFKPVMRKVHQLVQQESHYGSIH